MDVFKLNSVTLAVCACVLVYSVVGCSGSSVSTASLDKYDTMPYQDIMTVNVSKTAAYNAAIHTLQEHGYVVTVSDPQTGLINAEKYSPNKIAEEQKQDAIDHPGLSAGTVILIILGIVLIVGIVVLLLAANDHDSKEEKHNDDKSNDGEKKRIERNDAAKTVREAPHREHHHEHHDYIAGGMMFVPVPPEQAPVPLSYRYIVTLYTTPINDSTTRIDLTTERMVLENGNVMQSDIYENKYLNYSVFDGIEERLVSGQ